MANADRISEVYKGEIWKPRSQRRARERIDWLVSHARGHVLDLGCSQGIASILCARRGLEVLGVDREEDRIAYARRELRRRPREVRDRLEFRVADGARLDLEDGVFDSVLIGEIIEHLADPAPVLGEVARVTKPGGVVAITTPFGYSPHRDHRRTFYLASLVEAVGRHLTVESLEIQDGFFRVLARPGAMPAEARVHLIAEQQPLLERAFVAVHQRASRLQRRQPRLERLAVSLDAELARSRWRLRRIRRSRSWRLLRVLKRVRRHPGRVARLPRDLSRAARRVPIAPTPREGRLPTWAARDRPPRRGRKRPAELTPGADRDLSVEIPSANLPNGPIARPDLTVAVILDRFSELALGYEWRQVQFGPDDWRETLVREPPRLLFVESAWHGNRGRWHGMVRGRSGHNRRPLVELVAWCRERGIPTVFWNKEDPPNFHRFIETARLFDHVFTVDGDCVPRYREILGHERVSLLPFAAQPRIHNPVAVRGGRVHDVAFAGTYTASQYPERRRQVETILAPAREFGLHIFSRLGQGDHPAFEWPASYRPHIVGSLPYERMLQAYKAYKVFLNVNTVTGSPTMCSRRVFELAACGTGVLSARARAIEEVFGDLIPLADTPERARSELAALLDDAEARERRAHLATREVMANHTYGHRVDEILRAVGISSPGRTPSASVVLAVRRHELAAAAIQEVALQRRRPLELVLVPVAPGLDAGALARQACEVGIAEARVVPDGPSLDGGAALNRALEMARGDVVALMDDASVYGEHHLTDLVGAFSYTDAAIVGKPASDRPKLEHSYTDRVHPATIVGRAEVLRRLGFAEQVTDPAAELLGRCSPGGIRVYAADRFSFVAGQRAASASVLDARKVTASGPDAASAAAST